MTKKTNRNSKGKRGVGKQSDEADPLGANIRDLVWGRCPKYYDTEEKRKPLKRK